MMIIYIYKYRIGSSLYIPIAQDARNLRVNVVSALQDLYLAYNRDR